MSSKTPAAETAAPSSSLEAADPAAGRAASARRRHLDYTQKISLINHAIKELHISQLRDELTALQLKTAGSKDVLQARLRNHVKISHFGQTWTTLPFDFVCVVDFEATCDEHSRLTFPHEIIEFPIVVLNTRTCEIVSTMWRCFCSVGNFLETEFSTFCRPTLNPALTAFCTTLTGITQDNVDQAPVFGDVLRNVEAWLAEKKLGSPGCTFVLATDGPWDMRDFMTIQCALSQDKRPAWTETWLDVRRNFNSFYGTRCNLAEMLDRLGLKFTGRQHSGIDDSRNIAKIVAEMLRDNLGEFKLDRLQDSLGRMSAEERESLDRKCSSRSTKSGGIDQAAAAAAATVVAATAASKSTK